MGRKSTIETLPEDILKQLQALLLDPRITQMQVTRQINKLLKAQGHPEVSKSSVNRYAQSFEEMTAELVETDRMAALMLTELKISNQSSIGQVTAELLRTMVLHFLPLLKKAMTSGELDLKAMKDITAMMNTLSSSHERLETSASINEKRLRDMERVAEQKANQRAAENVEQAAKQMGLSPEQVQFWREQVLMGA